MAGTPPRLVGNRHKERGRQGRRFDICQISTTACLFYDTKNALRETLGREPSTDELLAEMEKQGIQAMATTSIFDPVLTELSYRWFNIEGGRILDPFAGGSVRGIVAAKLNMPYVGNDLREKQVVANIENAKEVLGNMPADIAPRWTVGDSTQLEDVLQKERRYRRFRYGIFLPAVRRFGSI